MSSPGASDRFVPAARFGFLTRVFDPFVRLTLPERTLKQGIIDGLAPGPLRVLDLGMGTGTLAVWLKQQRPELDVTGIDPDPEILAQARAKVRAAGVEIGIVEAGADALPFADGAFDAVVSTLVFHHLTTPLKRRALAEVARVLRPGGELHIGDWGKPRGLVQEALFLQARVFDGFDVTDANRRGLLPEMCEQAGLTRAEVRGERRTAFGTLALYRAVRP